MKKIDIKFTRNQSILPFGDVELESLIFLNLAINGKVYPFLFDTGANITVVNEDLVQETGLQVLKETVRGGGNAGNLLDTKVGIVDMLQFGEVNLANLKVVILPCENLTFVVDENNTQMKINGFLGWDVIQHFKWTINNINRTITVEKPVFEQREKNLSFDVLPTIMVEFQDEPLCFGFDSGNTESFLGIQMYDKLHPEKQKSDSFTGVDGTVEKMVYDVEDFKFSILEKEICLQHVPMLKQDVYISKTVQFMGLLASDIVKNKNWMIDFRNHHFEILN